MGPKYLLTKKPKDHDLSHISISKHDWSFQFPFPINGKQYANDRLADVSGEHQKVFAFFGESSWQIWQILVSQLTQLSENVFVCYEA